MKEDSHAELASAAPGRRGRPRDACDGRLARLGADGVVVHPRQASARLEAHAADLLRIGDTQSRRAARAITRINTALMQQERALLTSRGLPGRPWFRHQVYAPGLVTGYAVQYLPGMRDAIEAGDAQTAQTYRDLLFASLLEATRLAARGAGPLA